MTTKKINGLQFENMIRNGLANLRLVEKTVNALNVFPVADGDTGTNLCLTLENGIRSAKSTPELGVYLKDLSRGLLLGARGNSGVILSQFFRGLWQELKNCPEAGPMELRDALVCGCRTAYASMVSPVEGTMLTVFREGIEFIYDQIHDGMDIETLLLHYIGEMRKSLTLTTQRIPALRDAGVVDSGAMGFVIMAEGMLKCLNGEIIRLDYPAVESQNPVEDSTRFFHEDSVFEKGYCMEFILQRLKGNPYSQDFRVERFIEDLRNLGDSLAVVQDESRVKVHIHTKKPAAIMEIAQKFGEFATFKLENMQLQHGEHLSRQAQAAAPKAHKRLAIVCVANGDGTKQLFEELGCDYVIAGGSTMNTSTQEFTDAFAQLNADEIVVLPNHKNNIPAAEQAIKLYGKEHVHLLPSKSFAEGYFALAMDVADSTDVAYRISQMEAGMKGVTTLYQTVASSDYALDGNGCQKGDEIALNNEQLLCVSQDWCEALMQALRQVPDIDDKECCVIFRGSSASDEQQEMLEQQLLEAYPYLDPTFVDGGQDIYRWIVGIT